MMLNPRSFLLDAWRALSLIGISISVAVTSLVAANHGPNRKNLVESNADDVIPDKAVSRLGRQNGSDLLA
jgi:hypothetical protein